MSWDQTPPPINEGEDELQLKLQYAAIVARNERERFTAGYKIFTGPENYGRALQAQAWYFDPFVQDEITRLRADGPDDITDDEAKAAFENEVLQKFRNAEPKEAAALGKLYADVKGWGGNRGTNININQDNRVVQVLKVPTRDVTAEDDADFERRFYEQQNRLIADAKSARPIAA
jgi:hypothetical protein